MRIIYVLSGTYSLGGATKSFLNLLKEVRLNNDVLILTPDKRGVYQDLKLLNYNVKALPYYFNYSPRRAFKSKMGVLIKRVINRYSALCLWKLARDFKPHIIHSNSSVIDIGFFVAKWLHIPHVWHIREYGDKDFNLKIPHLSQRLHAPLNYSIAITKDIAKHRGVYTSKRNRVIYNGIIDKSEQLPIYTKEPYILYAGRIEPLKGFEDCVNAFIRIKEESSNNVKLLLAGDFSATGEKITKELQKVITEKNLTDSIQWLGGTKDILSLMSHALAIVIPSICEGFGRVMPEAMSQGCIVIGRNTGGTKEQMDNGIIVTGEEIALRFNNVEELKGRIEEIINTSPQGYNQMRERAFTTINKLYTNQEYTKQILSFYKSILESR